MKLIYLIIVCLLFIYTILYIHLLIYLPVCHVYLDKFKCAKVAFKSVISNKMISVEYQHHFKVNISSFYILIKPERKHLQSLLPITVLSFPFLFFLRTISMSVCLRLLPSSNFAASIRSIALKRSMFRTFVELLLNSLSSSFLFLHSTKSLLTFQCHDGVWGHRNRLAKGVLKTHVKS